MTEKQLQDVEYILNGAEYLEEKYMGPGAGIQGHQDSYIPIIKAREISETLDVQFISDAQIAAIRLIQSQQLEK
jgi:hypothetical protein